MKISKLLCLIIALSLIFCLSACGEDEKSDSSDQTSSFDMGNIFVSIETDTDGTSSVEP